MTSMLVMQLRADIIEGVHLPSSKLIIKKLCDRYKVSMAPMREALARLVSSGFIHSEDQRGYWVLDASPEDLLDITQARLLIESQALELSILKGGIDWESQLLSAHHKLKRLPIKSETGQQLSAHWDEAHKEFHDTLISACGSPVLIDIAANLRERSTRYRFLSTLAPKENSSAGNEEKRDIGAEHDAIVQAALKKDADTAKELLKRHYQMTADLALRQIVSWKSAARKS